ncbi:chemotaxis protein CheX [Clostridium aminobutyricum]|uniref:Chemotaxis protein CheX n=1 Tax=Clostridium aminobutyricum TaxID=33953 RepID=A0A939IIQ5_CLOAM|nr:chemotaxis protein CheX [Clostridium aminobutyricum]MBN7772798.1 chemotaxis protein CheX [Clostridium aminobutyricum]
MNREFVAAFSDAFLNVMPMLGITDVKLENQKYFEKQIDASGVIGIVGIIGELTGNVFFAMGEDCAKQIASYMMCGMEVTEFGELAQSAISELSNMLAANASISLSEMGTTIDISTPTLMNGEFTVSTSYSKVICLEMRMEDKPFYIYLSLEEK